MKHYLLSLFFSLFAVISAPTAEKPRTISPADQYEFSYSVIPGKGDTTLVFIHGWSGNNTFWREQLHVFARDYQIVAIDLPGHGVSKSTREKWTLEGLANDVARVVKSLGQYSYSKKETLNNDVAGKTLEQISHLKKVILIGHSMGGVVALMAASKVPDQVIGVVGVDTLHNAEFKWPSEMAQKLTANLETNYVQGLNQFVRAMFTDKADPKLVNWVIDQAKLTDRRATVELLRDFPNLDLRKWFSAVKVPIRCVNASYIEGKNFRTEVATNRKYSDFDVWYVERVGHFLMLERPREFNKQLRKALKTIVKKKKINRN